MKANLISMIYLFALAFPLVGFANQGGTCKYNCEVQPRCEAFAKIVETKYFGSPEGFELYNVYLMQPTKLHPHPSAYQFESYILAGSGGGGHEITITYEISSSRNQRSACKLQSIDGRSLQ